MNHIAINRSTILVMHQDPLLRAGLAAALHEHAAFEVLVDDGTPPASHEARIDVVITDYDEAIRLTHLEARTGQWSLAHARILALTSKDRETDIRRAIEAGIHGYLLVGGPLSELVDGVMTVAKGVRYLGRSVAQRIADSLTHTSLTTREVEVLRLVVAGESNKAIARQLHIELGTVKSHMRAIMTKLNATSRTQAASIAASRGLVEDRMPALSTKRASPELPSVRSATSAPRMSYA
jgi:two-component system NarL family response regulator